MCQFSPASVVSQMVYQSDDSQCLGSRGSTTTAVVCGMNARTLGSQTGSEATAVLMGAAFHAASFTPRVKQLPRVSATIQKPSPAEIAW